MFFIISTSILLVFLSLSLSLPLFLLLSVFDESFSQRLLCPILLMLHQFRRRKLHPNQTEDHEVSDQCLSHSVSTIHAPKHQKDTPSFPVYSSSWQMNLIAPELERHCETTISHKINPANYQVRKYKLSTRKLKIFKDYRTSLDKNTYGQ